MSPELFAQAVVYLAAAVVAVPIASRLGLGSVLGYLVAGVAIGPFALGLVGSEGQDVMHVAEFGVVMMLFLIGLELQPSLLWRLRSPILGFGGLQVLVTAVAVAGGGYVVGLDWPEAVAVGLIIPLSSTALVLQSLGERGLLKTDGGQTAFAVLLFQDIAVIPMLAVLPLLATHEIVAGTGGEHAGLTWIAGLPAWGQTLSVLGAVAAIVVGGRFLVRPAFRVIGRTRLRELFTAAALLLVVGIALLMTQVGLSPALGTFVAGVVLADSEYRHELESDIEPFKGLLLGLFFIAVGASIDFGLIAAEPYLIGGLVIAILALKGTVLLALARAFGLSLDQGLLVAFALPQVGEFAFVLLSFAGQEGVLGFEITSPLVAAVALSMAVTPILIAINERVVQPRVGTKRQDRAPDTVEEQHPVLIAGFGSFGSSAGRLLRANGIATTVLDHDSDRVELLRRLGMKVFYGDATRHDLLHAAGAAEARVIILALDSPERTLALVHTVRRHFPALRIFARAFDWGDAHRLLEAGVEHVYRESLDTSLRLGTDVLQTLGFRAHQAHRAAQKFRRYDEESVRTLTDQRGNRATYLAAARQRIEDLERQLLRDLQDPDVTRDFGWDAEPIREDVRGRAGLGQGSGQS